MKINLLSLLFDRNCLKSGLVVLALANPSKPAFAQTVLQTEFNTAAEEAYKRGDKSKACELYRAALQGAERAYGKDDLQVALELMKVSEVQIELGQFETARSSLARAKAIFTKARYKETETLVRLDKLLAKCTAKSDGEQTKTATDLLVTRAKELIKEHQIQQAEEILQKYLHEHERLYPDDVLPRSFVNVICNLYVSKNELDKAQSIYEQTLEKYQQAHGKLQPYCAELFLCIATIYDREGKTLEAQTLTKKAFEIYDSYKDTSSLKGLTAIANQFWDEEQFDLTEKVMIHLVDVAKKNDRREPIKEAQALNNLSVYYTTRNQHAAADKAMKEALALRKKCLTLAISPDSSVLVRKASNSLKLSNYVDAEAALDEAAALDLKELGSNSPYFSIKLQEYAAMLEAAGDQSGATRFDKKAKMAHDGSNVPSGGPAPTENSGAPTGGESSGLATTTVLNSAQSSFVTMDRTHPFIKDVSARIRRAWFPPKGDEQPITVSFKIHRGGELSNLRLVNSGGSPEADKAALKAVENAAPFRPLPANTRDDVDIEYIFDYSIFNRGGSNGIIRF